MRAARPRAVSWDVRTTHLCAVPSPSRARPPKVPASLSYTFRLFSLNNIY